MKRGGQVIYAGPLGRHSHKLIEYFEASLPLCFGSFLCFAKQFCNLKLTKF